MLYSLIFTESYERIEKRFLKRHYRITLVLELREQEIILVSIGSHGEVY